MGPGTRCHCDRGINHHPIHLAGIYILRYGYTETEDAVASETIALTDVVLQESPKVFAARERQTPPSLCRGEAPQQRRPWDMQMEPAPEITSAEERDPAFICLKGQEKNHFLVTRTCGKG